MAIPIVRDILSSAAGGSIWPARLALYSAMIWISSVDPIIINKAGTIDVITPIGISSNAMPASVQTIDIPAVNKGMNAPLILRMPIASAITRNAIDQGMIDFWSDEIFRVMVSLI